jgi:uncharacterized protein (DUF2252 family)
VAFGKSMRTEVPLERHAELALASSRDPVGLVVGQDASRVAELVPIRHGRMAVSPFTFYRGAALVMAADLDATPTSGLRTQLCGDAHLSNLGGYASPERSLVFDINDFDETLPGPFEWDVKRLATSFVVAGRDNGLTAKQCRKVAVASVEAYRTSIREFAGQPTLSVWYAHLDLDAALGELKARLSAGKPTKRRRAGIDATEASLAKAHTRDSLQAARKLTTVVDGVRRFVSDPPLVVPLAELTDVDRDEVLTQLRALLERYRSTLRADCRVLFHQFALVDVAHKVVGVGSVGTRAWILLFESDIDGEVLVLQAKQAQESVLDGFAGASEHSNQAERVVAGQHLMQASSDIFLGWVRLESAGRPHEDYYVRQLRDWKTSAAVEEMDAPSLGLYARMCGWTLARAHARSGDRLAIAAYPGQVRQVRQRGRGLRGGLRRSERTRPLVVRRCRRLGSDRRHERYLRWPT